MDRRSGTASADTAGDIGRLLLLGIAREEFEGFWRGYFDLDRDYEAIVAGFPDDERLQECPCFAPGVRILRSGRI